MDPLPDVLLPFLPSLKRSAPAGQRFRLSFGKSADALWIRNVG
jgi:hypothetical protein